MEQETILPNEIEQYGEWVKNNQETEHQIFKHLQEEYGKLLHENKQSIDLNDTTLKDDQLIKRIRCMFVTKSCK